MDKICEIVNGQFSWVMKVDNQVISFQGSDNADYFVIHYNKLGYIVIFHEYTNRPGKEVK